MSETVTPTPAQLASLRYKEGDEILCYEPDPKKKQVLYHARIKEIEFEDINQYLEDLDKSVRDEVSKSGVNIQPMFHIHFLQWGPKYNRWVMEDMILDITEENLAIKAELDGKKGTSTRGRFSSGTPVRKRVDSGTPVTRKRVDSETRKRQDSESLTKDTASTVEDEVVEVVPVVGLKITLPDPIKQSLERDYINIKLRNQVVKLPRTPNVRDILSHWAERTINEDRDNEVLVEEFVDGITTYFDFMLPIQLLYKEEKIQYEQVGYVHGAARCRRQQLTQPSGTNTLLYPGYKDWGDRKENRAGPIKPSTLYGIEHLLRLFVKLPGYLDHIPSTFLPTLSLYCEMFLRYVECNKAEVFVEVQPYQASSELSI